MRNIGRSGAAVALLSLLLGCGGQPSSGHSVRMVLGHAWIVRGGEKLEAKAGVQLKEGDAIETGAGSLVVADLNGGIAQVEIQENALFRLESVEGSERTVAIDRGSLWFRVSKLVKGGTYRLRTPSCIAAVRGTKMFRFVMGDADGMCHCEGDVAYRSISGDYEGVHHRDFMAFTRGGATVLLPPEDLAFMMIPGAVHRHSAIDNSPLGPKAPVLTEAQQRRFAGLVRDRLSRTQ
ncbi:MAG: FecR domain-containing protein [Spirochaetes bacterium]|nr:FecR domain-containing protein [Spirochaetota bacterium]